MGIQIIYYYKLNLRNELTHPPLWLTGVPVTNTKNNDQMGRSVEFSKSRPTLSAIQIYPSVHVAYR